MTRVLLSIAVERVEGENVLVTTWQATADERRAVYDQCPPGSPVRDPSFRLVKVEREPWTDLRVAELIATYGERPIMLAADVSFREKLDAVQLARLWAPEEAVARYLDYLDTLTSHSLVTIRPGLAFSVELLRESILEHRKGVRAALIEAGQ